MKEHKHNWIVLRGYETVLTELLIVYYICEECKQYKIVKFSKLHQE